ncbi:MAG TPA: hypothetical protein VGJ20_25390 [Xanthobacteraceae bacterium]
MRGLPKHTRDFRRLISYHEAGHAVVARKVGIEVLSIDMIAGDNGSLASVATRSAYREAVERRVDLTALTRGLYADAMAALAGPAAGEMAGYPINHGGFDFQSAFSSVVAQARIEAGLSLDYKELTLDPGNPVRVAANAIMERAWTETIALLQGNWQAVVRVAGALRKCDRLTQAELDRVIAHGQRGRQ